MQSILKGYAGFFKGEFTDKQTGVVTEYNQLAVMEKTDKGFNLVKVSVGKDKVSEAEKLDAQYVEVLCDMQETNYNGKGVKFVYNKGKIVNLNPVPKAVNG